MSKVFCGDCEYCIVVNRENTSAKCQHLNNMVDENWYSVDAKDTCAFLNENNDCTWFSDKRISGLRHSKTRAYIERTSEVKNKYRIVKLQAGRDSWFHIQIKRWWLPFWYTKNISFFYTRKYYWLGEAEKDLMKLTTPITKSVIKEVEG